jgi:hypothetical protein
VVARVHWFGPVLAMTHWALVAVLVIPTILGIFAAISDRKQLAIEVRLEDESRRLHPSNFDAPLCKLHQPDERNLP